MNPGVWAVLAAAQTPFPGPAWLAGAGLPGPPPPRPGPAWPATPASRIPTITGCSFERNFGAGGGAIASGGATTATIADTIISRNTSIENSSPQYGGGILIAPSGATDDDAIILTLTGTTEITRNSGNEGSGIAVLSSDPSYKWTVTGAPGRVFSNIGAPDQCAISTNGGSTWTAVPNCAF